MKNEMYILYMFDELLGVHMKFYGNFYRHAFGKNGNYLLRIIKKTCLLVPLHLTFEMFPIDHINSYNRSLDFRKKMSV